MRQDEERYCSKCGINEEDDEWQRLHDIRVVVADGEEGYANIIMLLCEECAHYMYGALISLGFYDHRHGGINFLESPYCDYENCPTPSDYGEFVAPPSR